MAQNSPTKLEDAIRLASRGWNVFPVYSIKGELCTCGNPQCPHKAKHPCTKNGLKGATTDETQIRKWWTHWPDANIAVATGQRSDIFVLDVDRKPDVNGHDTLQELIDHYGLLPPTLMSRTGGGGQHYFFRFPEREGIRNSEGKLGSGLDIRAEGGYVIVAPSIHASGNAYEWLENTLR